MDPHNVIHNTLLAVAPIGLCNKHNPSRDSLLLEKSNWVTIPHGEGGVAKVGGYLRAPSNTAYDFETLVAFDVSGLSGTITSAKLRFFVSGGATGVDNMVELYEQSIGPWDTATVDYDTFNNLGPFASEGWTQLLGSVPVSIQDIGWKEISSDELKSVIQQWVNDPSTNQGLVLTGNFAYYAHFIQITAIELILEADNVPPPPPPNPELTLAPIGNQSVEAGQSLDFQLSATTNQPGPITFSIVSQPPESSFDSSTGAFSWTPRNAFVGDHFVTFIASDGVSNESQSITITVTEPSVTPEITLAPIGNQTIEALQVLTLQLTATSNQPEPILFSASPEPNRANMRSDGLFTWVPFPDQEGNHVVTFTASNGIISDSETITITVLPLPPPPELTLDPIANQNIEAGQTLTLQLNATSNQPEPISFSLSPIPTGAALDPSTGMFSWTPSESFIGNVFLTFTASDGNLSDSQQVIITVTAPPPPPEPELTLATIGNQTIEVDNTLSLQLSATSNQPEPISFSVSPLPAGASLDASSGLFVFTPSLSQLGPISVTFTASDGILSASEVVTITVTAPPPFVTLNPIPNQSIEANQTLSIQLNATSNRLAPISFSIDALPVNANFNSTTGFFVWTPESNQAGSHPLTFTASDGNASDSQNTTITITAPPPEPGVLIGSIGDQSLNLGERFELQLRSSNNSDGIRFFAEPLPLFENATLNSQSGLFTFTPSEEQVGNFTLAFRATEGSFNEAETITLTVNAPPTEGDTALRGRILEANQAEEGHEVPLEGVTVRHLDSGLSTTTDAQGYFTLSGLEAGENFIEFDGSTEGSTQGYASYRSQQHLIAHITNTISRPIYLMPIDPEGEALINPNTTSTVNNSGLGILLRIPPNTLKQEDGSDFDGVLSVSEVPPEFTPSALPDFMGPSLVITLQPMGLVFNEPAEITFPNVDQLAPGSQVQLWALNHETGEFEVTGVGRVNNSGTLIETISGGVTGTSWFFIFPPPSEPPPPDVQQAEDNQGPRCSKCPTGSSTSLAEGNLSVEHELIGYRSLNQTRNLQLNYSSLSAAPRTNLGVIQNLNPGGVNPTPGQISAQFEVGGIDLGQEIFFSTEGIVDREQIVLAQPFNAQALTTGAYPYTTNLTSHFGASSISTEVPGMLVINNQSNSEFGAGWQLQGLQRLRVQSNGDLLLTDSNQASLLYRFNKTLLPADEAVLAQFDFHENLLDSSGNSRHSIHIGQGSEFVDTPLGKKLRVGTPSPFDSTLNISGIEWNQVNLPLEFPITIEIVLTPDTLSSPSFPAAIIFSTNRLTTFYQDGGIVFPRLIAAPELVGEGQVTEAGIRHYLSFVFTKSGATHIYFQGNLIGTSSLFADLGVPMVEFSNALRFFNGDFRQLQATIDFLRISEGSRTSAEIAAFQQHLETIESEDDLDTVYIAPKGEFSNIVQNPDGTYTRTLKDNTQIHFNVEGLHTSTVELNGNTTSYAYDNQDRLVSITDPAGKITTLAYDSSHLSSITDPTGRITQFFHDAEGNLIRIVDPDSSERQFTYDNEHRLITQTSKRGFVTGYSYNSAGRNTLVTLPDGSTRQVSPSDMSATLDPTSGLGTANNPAPAILTEDVRARLTDGNGQTTSYVINRFGTIIESIDPLGRRITTEMNANGDPATIIDASGDEFDFTYDHKGNIISLSVPSGFLEFEYDELSSQRTQIAISHGLTSTFNFEYDAQGNLTRSIDAERGERTFSHNAQGLVLTETNENGHATTFTYDSNGNLATRTNALGHVQQFQYDPAGNITSITEAVGLPEERTLQFAYDAMNRLTTLTDGEGANTQLRYDVEGNLLEIESPTGEIARRAYDFKNRITRIEDPIQGTTQFAYDVQGNLIRTENALGQVTELEYDAVNQLVRTLDARNGEQLFTYDLDGNVASFQNANGHSTTFTYDGLNRVQTMTNPLGQTTTFGYRFPFLSLVNSIDFPEGRMFRGYDSNGRLTALIANRLTDDTSRYTYDAAGNLTQMHIIKEVEPLSFPATTEFIHRTDFTYDALNRQRTADTTFVGCLVGGTQCKPFQSSLAYDYDALGRRTELRDTQGGQLHYQYDADNRLKQIMTHTGDIINIDHDAAGRLTEIQHPNGQVSSWEYDVAGRLNALRHGDAIQPGGLVEYLYQYDGLGQIIGIDDNRNTQLSQQQFTYDDLQRLTLATIQQGTLATLINSYDPLGNLRSLDFVHDANNQMLEDSEFLYTYDDNGNLIQKERKSDGAIEQYRYNNHANRLDEYIDANGQRTRYHYDALGRRYAKVQDDIAHYYLHDQDQLYLQFDLFRLGMHPENPLAARFVHGQQVDQPLSIEKKFPTLRTRRHLDWTPHASSLTHPFTIEMVVTPETTDDTALMFYGFSGALGWFYENGSLRISGMGTRSIGEGLLVGGERHYWAFVSTSTTHMDVYFQGQFVDNIEIGFTPPPPVVNFFGRKLMAEALRIGQGSRASEDIEATQQLLETGNPRIILPNVFDPGTFDTLANFHFNEMEFQDSNTIVDQSGNNRNIPIPSAIPNGTAYGSPAAEGDLYYYHTDHLGSIRFLTNANGFLVAQYDYDPYGKFLIRNESLILDIPNPFFYTAREFDDESGLYYYRNRYYSPEMQRFITLDPIGFAGGDPNLYAYVGNDPINFKDPDGLVAAPVAGGLFGVFFGGVGGALVGLATGQNVAKSALQGAISGGFAGFGAGLLGAGGAKAGLKAGGIVGSAIFGGAQGGFVGGLISSGDLTTAGISGLLGGLLGINPLIGAASGANAASAALASGLIRAPINLGAGILNSPNNNTCPVQQ